MSTPLISRKQRRADTTRRVLYSFVGTVLHRDTGIWVGMLKHYRRLLQVLCVTCHQIFILFDIK